MPFGKERNSDSLFGKEQHGDSQIANHYFALLLTKMSDLLKNQRSDYQSWFLVCLVFLILFGRLLYIEYIDPAKLVIVVSDAPEWAEVPSDAKVAYGEPLTLHCRAVGQPTPTITWWRDNTTILASGERIRFAIFLTLHCRAEVQPAPCIL